MSKITTLYVSMIVVFIGGLWTTLHLGQRLKAPHDLSGKWVGVNAAGPLTLSIDQSGRFLKLTVDGRVPADLRLSSDDAAGQGRRMVFVGGGQEMAVEIAPAQTPVDAVYRFRLRGPLNGDVTAKRETPAVDPASPAKQH